MSVIDHVLEVVVGRTGVGQRWRGFVGIGHLCGYCVMLVWLEIIVLGLQQIRCNLIRRNNWLIVV
jgi:hypothetical protein